MKAVVLKCQKTYTVEKEYLLKMEGAIALEHTSETMGSVPAKCNKVLQWKQKPASSELLASLNLFAGKGFEEFKN